MYYQRMHSNLSHVQIGKYVMFEDIWLSHKDDTFQWDQNSFVFTILEIPSFEWIFVGKLDLNHCQLLYFSYKRQISTVMTSLGIFYNAF